MGSARLGVSQLAYPVWDAGHHRERQFRVRFHSDLVRIEIAPEEMERALAPEMARAFTAIFKPLGFHYVTLDLEGYRQGSLNAVLQT
jgi:pyridinium-3,5-biscarboxylic acid mononucleotide sulfurtransferase